MPNEILKCITMTTEMSKGILLLCETSKSITVLSEVLKGIIVPHLVISSSSGLQPYEGSFETSGLTTDTVD